MEQELSALVGGWEAAVRGATEALGWSDVRIVHRRFSRLVAFALTAPVDRLLTATEVNEWSWQQGCLAAGRDLGPELFAPGDVPRDPARAIPHLRALASAESNPRLIALLEEASQRAVPARWDDDALTLGMGATAQQWPVRSLPAPTAVAWEGFGRVPIALVTGSNGKTTTVRALAAILTEAEHSVGYSCTDGLFVAGDAIEKGDWSGPAGARRILADPRTTAAVLETARGGILRRGLAVNRADVAVITNIAADHVGDYGIETLEELGEVKLTLTHALRGGAPIVLNGDDETLVRLAARPALRREASIVWSHPDDAAAGRQRAEQGEPCGWVSPEGQLMLGRGGSVEALIGAAEIPITGGGAARHNVANALAAALAADAMGIDRGTIRRALSRFGRDATDNPGRFARFDLRGAKVVLDYAHNPHGLEALLDAARALGEGRLLLLLGQAGDRADEDIRALARTAAVARPSLVVLKDLDGYLRGRRPGEVPALIEQVLLEEGVPAEAIRTVLPEVEAARALLAMAREGDVVVLPVHALSARQALEPLLGVPQRY